MSADARIRFLDLVQRAVADRKLDKLTLGKYRGSDHTLQKLFIRPVQLKAGPHLSFLWRHTTRDITKNHSVADAAHLVSSLIGSDFLDAHLFTHTETAQLECQPEGRCRLHVKAVRERPGADRTDSAARGHDRIKSRIIPADAAWLRALGVTNEHGRPREGMSDKFRQIEKFAELLQHLLAEAGLIPTVSDQVPPVSANAMPPPVGDNDDSPSRLRVVDMGSGKGYLTFAVAALLGSRATVLGVESRQELANFCNGVATELALAPGLRFTAGTIAETSVAAMDVLIALHACDTATDDALAKGISAGARLLVVSPCCQKELRPQLTAPAVLADALQHGIFQERQAEFVTDALRAELLEWAGYRTKVFEFISTEHTAKNLMIAAIKERPRGESDDPRAQRIRAFAQFYGIRSQALARHLDFSLGGPDSA
jgi:hypothetical protein